MSLFLKAPVHSLCMGQLQFLFPSRIFPVCASLYCAARCQHAPQTWLPSLSWKHLSSVSFYHNRVLVFMPVFEMGIDQRLQPSWERPHKKVCDRWQIAIAELVLSPGPALGTEWMSVVCLTCTTGIVTHKHMNSWAVLRWLSPCIALPPHQQPAHAWVNRVAGSTQTRPLTVKVGLWGCSLFWEGLQALHITRATTTKQWSWCSPTI